MKKMVLVPLDLYEQCFPTPKTVPADIEAKLVQQSLHHHEMPVDKPKSAPLLPLAPDFIEKLDVKYRKKAQLMLKHIEGEERIKFADTGELIHNDQLISGSHIADLLYDMAKPASALRPTGIKEFLVQLKRTNIPRSYIGNKHRVTEMDLEHVPFFGENVIVPPVSTDDFPSLPPTPVVARHHPIVPKRQAAERIKQRRVEERQRWNPY